MSATNINIKKIGSNEFSIMPDFLPVASDTSIGAGKYGVISSAVNADRLLIMIKNDHATAAKVAKILKGNTFGSIEDISVSIEAGGSYCVVIESLPFYNDGVFIIEGESTDIKAACVLLP